MTKILGMSVLSALLCIACSNNDTPPAKLVDTYAKILLIRNSGVDSIATSKRVDSTLSANGYTRESLREELKAMNKSPKLFKAFMDSVSYRLR